MPQISSILLPGSSEEDYFEDLSGVSILAGCAGFHNSTLDRVDTVLGNQITADQYQDISLGLFETMNIGDCWLINTGSGNTVVRILAFDYFYGRGDKDNNHIITDHHVVVGFRMGTCTIAGTSSSTATTSGGSYAAVDACCTVPSGFTLPIPSEHRLTWWDSYSNAASNGVPSAGAWYERQIAILNEAQVFGSRTLAPMTAYTSSLVVPWIYSLSEIQFPYFESYGITATLVGDGTRPANGIWLSDIIDSTAYAIVDPNGRPNKSNSHTTRDVVVYMCIK